MTYDFTTILDRKGRDALALDLVGAPGGNIPAPRAGFDPIPMWVADMSFPTLPAIQEAIIERTRHPSFGYFLPREEYFDAIRRWQETRHGVTGVKREHIGYENGVLGGVVSALNAICEPGEGVLIHSPTYIGFTSVLKNNGYRAVLSPLIPDSDSIWRMDLADMERKLRENRLRAVIFCSPHNPTGRVWERGELEAAMELFRACGVTVISDEIWSDILMPGQRHIPLQSVSDDARRRTVALYAPSKTFSLAGLIGSYHIIYDPALRARVEREGSLSHYNSMNVLSMYALMGAYGPEGGVWVDELCQVLAENIGFAVDFIRERFPGVRVARPQGTYMLFLDCTDWCAAHQKSLDELLRAGFDVGVVWQDGRPFHGPCHIRMNLALPHERVREAFRRLDRYVFNP